LEDNIVAADKAVANSLTIQISFEKVVHAIGK